jgi:hypothetical protein
MKKLILIVVALCCVLQASAQNVWYFGKKHTAKFEDSWTREHVVRATRDGNGAFTACDAEGNPLDRYEILADKPIAGPFKPGDCFIFNVQADGVRKGSYVDFNTTFSIEDGAPMDWIVEVLDEGTWKPGEVFRCYGPVEGKAHRYTSVHQTFRLEDPAKDFISVRLRALDGFVRPSKGGEKEGGACFIGSSYLGVQVSDFGTTPPKDTLKVLCIGNSFTYYLGCPAILKEIAWKEGHYVDMASSLKGGWSMGQHLSLETTNDLVAEGGYDYVFLQDQSQAAARVGKDRKKYDNLIRNIAAMAAKVRTNSEDCKAVVEYTWAYAKNDYGSFGSLEAFDKYGKKGARIMAKAVGNAEVSPIAEAFAIVRKERPDINLYHTDNHHQSLYGSYLKSCVNYLVIFGEPFGDSPSDYLVEPEIAAYLRSVAEKTVL